MEKKKKKGDFFSDYLPGTQRLMQGDQSYLQRINITTGEAEAREKKCLVFINNNSPVPGMYPMPMMPIPCVASECVAYWQWVDETHTKGYCNVAGKPEVE
jgi:hypothetical protein